MISRSRRFSFSCSLPHFAFAGLRPQVDASNVRLKVDAGLGHALSSRFIWLVDRRIVRRWAHRMARRSGRA